MIYPNEFVAEILFQNGPRFIKIEGNSMAPIFVNNQTIRIYPLKNEKLHLGKCYVYINRGKLIIHRLLWMTRSEVFFAGDANNYIEKIPYNSVIGVPSFNAHGYKHIVYIFVNSIFFVFRNFHFIFKIRLKALRFFSRSGHL